MASNPSPPFPLTSRRVEKKAYNEHRYPPAPPQLVSAAPHRCHCQPPTKMTFDTTPSHAQVEAIRHFNRFYTRQVGVLKPYGNDNLTLTEVRVLYELAHAENDMVATDVARALAVDNGYLSRILKRFETKRWISRQPNPADGRQSILRLTDAGREVFAPLEAKSQADVAALLGPLSPVDRQKLITSMTMVEDLIHGESAPSSPREAPAPTPAPARDVVVRDPRSGDIGWVVQANGESYYRERGWNWRFEAMVADIMGQFVRNFDATKEKGWIAEVDGERAGSIFLVQGSAPDTAKLRMLFLTPAARGLGLGGRLVDECIAFARDAGYSKVELWTHSCLTDARRIYAKRGFVHQEAEDDHYVDFGEHELVGENWVLHLKA